VEVPEEDEPVVALLKFGKDI
jgi:hypothetical protein